MNLNQILQSVRDAVDGFRYGVTYSSDARGNKSQKINYPEMLSPLASSQPTPTPMPTPTPTPAPQQEYRNPMVATYLAAKNRALKPDEMLSGTRIASEESGVPMSLLMDIAGLESNAGTFDRPFAPKDNPTMYDDESNARGAFMFLANTARGAGGSPEDRYSATESARMTAKKLKKGQLGEWDISDKPGAGGGKLTDWYSEEELAPYSTASLQRRKMLQQLAKLGIE